MEFELNREELGQVLQAMRVLLPNIGEERFQSLLEAQEKLSSAGFLEAVWGIVRLQEEKGIDLSDAIDEYQNLLKKNEKLAREQTSLKKKNEELEEIRKHLLVNLTAEKEELEATRSRISQEKEQLAALAAQAAREKEQIIYELEKCREKAGVTEKDVKMAGSLKAKVKRSGFELDMMLDLVKEFASYPDSRERLVKVLEKEGSLTQRISALKKEVKEQESTLASTIAQLTSQKTQEENELKYLKNICHRWESNLNHLKADVAEEQRLRQFVVRYQSEVGLLEYLASWKQVRFLRCNNPGCEPFGGINHFWTEKQAVKCPHCGSGLVHYDKELYEFLNLEMQPYKLTLGQ